MILFWILFCVGIIMSLLIYFSVFKIKYRYPFLGILTAGMVVSIINQKMSFADLGLIIPTRNSIILYSTLTLLGLLISTSLKLKDNIKIDLDGHSTDYQV